MIPENLVFLQCVPHDPYFQWQIEVQVVNFRKFNISDRMEIVVWYPTNSKELGNWQKIQEKYPEIKIFLYEDSGVNLGLYVSQLRPHSLKKHFSKHAKRLAGKIFFYHDSDIIFNYLPDFEKLCADDISWQSDTSGYLDYNYLRRKEKQGNIPEHEAIRILAKMGGVSVNKIRSQADNTGGAQYILKNAIDFSFWEDIELQCLKIRNAFFWQIPDSVNRIYFKNEAEGFQSWCADMWAINFALWKRGVKTQVTKELDFSWATDDMETYLRKPIFHNAGASATSKDVFHKGSYILKSPLYQNLPLPPENKASRIYVQAINEVK